MRRLSLPLAGLALAALACTTLFPPRPDVAWDTAPTAVVIELATVGGLVPDLFMDNYIPAARVWGDGRVVWTEYADGGRRVLAGQLTPDELRALLQRLVDAGFFGWRDHYEPPYEIYDAGTTILRVHLTGTSKTVSEYVEGAPAAFHTLTGELAAGAGAAGQDFTPERGYLRAYPRTWEGATPARTWPDEGFGFTLAEAAAGRYLEGAPLAFAWEAVNQDAFGLIESVGQTYQITLQVPGVSYLAPPAN